MSVLRHDCHSSPLLSGAGDFPAWPEFDEEQRRAVESVLASGRVNYWTGDEARQFERDYAAALGVEHVVAVANGTVALELALEAIGIGPGDEVIVPSRTFIATATCVVRRGGIPVFADVDPLSGNLSAETVEPLINWRTRAVIAVHLAGWPCEMPSLIELSRRFGLIVIEDCAQAHGARLQGRAAGAWGDIACFSFCQDKIITTGGEGGLVVTSNTQLFRRIWSLKDHGKDWDAVYHREHAGLFKWLHESIGTNARLTEMQAALGRIQLRRLPEWVAARRRNAELFNRRLQCVPGLRTVEPPPHVLHSYYKLYAFVEPSALAPDWSRDRLARQIQSAGVPCGPGSCCEIYLERSLMSYAPQAPRRVARRLGETSLMLVVHPTLESAHIEEMFRRIENVFQQAAAERYSAAA